MLQPSPDWYMSTTFLPSPTSPSSDRSQLLIPPPASSTHYHHYSYSPPTLPITHSAVDSCRWISREQPLLLSPQSLSTSSSLPSPLLPVDQPLHSAHEHGAPSSIASSSTSRLDDPLQQQTARSPGVSERASEVGKRGALADALRFRPVAHGPRSCSDVHSKALSNAQQPRVLGRGRLGVSVAESEKPRRFG